MSTFIKKREVIIVESSKEREYFTPRQVSGIVGLDVSTIRKYVDHFEIQTEWTKEDQQGHRRYTKGNIEELLQIKKLVQENKMTWDQAKAHINGHENTFVVDMDKTREDKKQDKQLEAMLQLLEGQERQEQMISELSEDQKEQRDFNKALLEQLQLITSELAATKQTVNALETKNTELEDYIDNRLKVRDQLLLENIRQNQEQKQESKKRKKLFGLF
ncbi:MerR family transcriptional regulator (plasmid) [Bacillus mycoides]|nr:MerR family transcriptional regulator [Bacillus mycoides]